jgi:hypothetical protein
MWKPYWELMKNLFLRTGKLGTKNLDCANGKAEKENEIGKEKEKEKEKVREKKRMY